MDIDFFGFEDLPSTLRRCVLRRVAKMGQALDNNLSLTMSLVSAAEMTELCEKFKGHRQVTDVLSFPMPAEERAFSHTEAMLGDVVICLEQATIQATACGHDVETELAVLAAHGIMHLLGFDHERSAEEAGWQMQGEMYLLECAGVAPEACLIGRSL